MEKIKMDDLVNYCKNYGFIFQGSSIYGGLSNSWDYGPLGRELKENIKKCWWQKFIQENPYNFGIDSTILMNPNVWISSGHVTNFNDPLIDCKNCKKRYRADNLIEEFAKSNNVTIPVEGKSGEELVNIIKSYNITCPSCHKNDFTDIRKFNLLFETNMGVTEDTKNKVYLRGETAQGIFINFLNVQRSMRLKLPFGIGQIGKSFRNEITPGNFIFRMREFEQMELEFFCKPGTDLEWFGYYKNFCLEFLKELGIKKENLRFRDHAKEELSFYSKATTDIEYKFPFGWGELWGIADRTDYDLSVHEKGSKTDLKYLDPITNEKYLPYVIEPSLGLDRTFLTIICDAYNKEVLEDNSEREVLKIHPYLAPIKVTILPLVKKYHTNKALEIYEELCKFYNISFDDAGSIGKRYRRADAVGTPYCITVDDDTLKYNTITIRNRDTMEQEKLNIKEIINYLNKNIKF